ncbi:MAG TPA: metal-dependent transcriptional regulator [Saprospiraceae bacterium]|jgi:DtxR family transcriptional regulator, Mn-dependent transcriptional regulator
MGLSYAEENYLKAILKLSGSPDGTVSTNAIAAQLDTSAASVTDMLKKLSDKELITYQRYKGASLTEEGQRVATMLVRKHRLWEVFLVQSLGMTWDEVHEIAEELEHIQSDRLIDRLDVFLGHPKFDPHGDPIPNAQGKYTLRAQFPLTELKPGQEGVVIGVREDDTSFLKHLNDKGLTIGKSIIILSNDEYDNTLRVSVDDLELNLSGKVARSILIKPV